MVLRKLRTLRRLGPRGVLLILEAGAMLALARLSLALFSFEQIVHRRGRFSRPDDVAPADEADRATGAIARQVGWAIRTAAPRMPFRAVCLQQALAAQDMLRRRGIHTPVHFGVGHDENNRFQAHAWLDVAGVEVTGYPVAASFREIGALGSGQD